MLLFRRLKVKVTHEGQKLKILLKMLGLYLYILKFSHKSCNILSVLNKLALQKELQIFVTHSVFLDKNQKHDNNNKKYQT